MNLTFLERYPQLRIGIVGDFCLDRYLEIDPQRSEISIETGLPVHNVVNVRSQPGGAGTILNNLAALGIGEIIPIGFRGEDGEGFELFRALQERPGVRLDHFHATVERRTFTYCKPLLLQPGSPPEELSRLDSKNWSATPRTVSSQIAAGISAVADSLNALILLDQVDLPETGVVTQCVLDCVAELSARRPELLILADSRRGLRDYPPVCLKMNGAEFATLAGCPQTEPVAAIQEHAARLASERNRPVFISLAERGIVGATPGEPAHLVAAFPVHGPIDIVGAGDAVTANLTAALAGGANLADAMRTAMAAASIVIHQLGTTGTANRIELRALLGK